MAHGKTVYRKDYQVPPFLVDSIELTFDLYDDHTLVTQVAVYRRNPEASKDADLCLNGQDVSLQHVQLNEQMLSASDYQLTDEQLILRDLPEQFSLEIVTKINPHANKSLNGLYCSNNVYCTQCEAEGFRCMTYFQDRPDVMTIFTTTITADKSYSYLLSNGNLVAEGELEDDRHYATWHDPHKKPCYLFALVAGDLAMVEDSFTTMSGREVCLRIFVEHGKQDKTAHAMWSLQQAMRWDEERFGREYDLDLFMIVAVSDFNMGAMENKGLNIFNDKYILADNASATDRDFIFISIVVGHEYFHNWTGNRVTCRDWFQLSLKEGLTVFRDQEFSADLFSRPVRRIEQVNTLRARQFPEDASPMAHPIRPDSFMEINNFYTVTIYEKGAEVIRMQHSLLGEAGFRRGMDLYFTRHDAQAVTCDDFVAAMSDANQVDLTQFKRWYSQAGTPQLTVSWTYDATNKQLTLHTEQTCPATPGQADKQAFHIPLRLALLNEQGQAIDLRLADEAHAVGCERVLNIDADKQDFIFIDVTSEVLPSLLRGFSAPVKLVANYSDEQLCFLIAHDDDPFARFEATQQFATKLIINKMQNNDNSAYPANFIAAMRQLITNNELDPALRAEAMHLPSMADLIEQLTNVDVERLYTLREQLCQQIADELQADILALYHQYASKQAYQFTGDEVAKRALKNTCLRYLNYLPAHQQLITQQYQQADNMTDSIAALSLIAEHNSNDRQQALDDFDQKWQADHLVMDKWFAVQAMADRDTVLNDIKQLMQHSVFSLENPNRVRALIGSFSQANWRHFHRPDGAGYALLTEVIIAIDKFNPQTAARLLTPLINWHKFDAARQTLIKQQLIRIKSENPSKDVFEIVDKSLPK